MNKIIIILMALFLLLTPIAHAGYQMVYNPLIGQNLDYVRDGNWSDYNGTMEFPSLDVAGGYANGGVTIEDDGDFWTKGDIYLDNGTVFLVTNPVINGSFYPAIDDTFNFGSDSLRWGEGFFSNTLRAKNLLIDGSYIGTYSTSSGFRLQRVAGTSDTTLKSYDDGNITINPFEGGNATLYLGVDSGDETQVTGDLFPKTHGTYDLGTSSNRWESLYLTGVAYGNALAFTGNARIGGTSSHIKIEPPYVLSHNLNLTLDSNDDGAGVLYLGNNEGDRVEIQENDSLRIANNNWLQWWNNATTSNINVVTVNEDNDAVLGTNLITAGTDFKENSGTAVLMDMPVSASAVGEQSYALRLDSNEIAKVRADPDGAGSITNESFDVLTNNGIRVGASSSGDIDINVISIMESEGVTGQIKWDDGLTAWDMTEPLGSNNRFAGGIITMSGIYGSANGNGQVDTTGTGTVGLVLSSQDAASPDIVIDPNRDGAGKLYLGNDEGDNATVRDGDRFVVEGFALGSDECYLYDGEGNCRLAGNSTATWILSPAGTAKVIATD